MGFEGEPVPTIARSTRTDYLGRKAPFSIPQESAGTRKAISTRISSLIGIDRHRHLQEKKCAPAQNDATATASVCNNPTNWQGYPQM